MGDMDKKNKNSQEKKENLLSMKCPKCSHSSISDSYICKKCGYDVNKKYNIKEDKQDLHFQVEMGKKSSPWLCPSCSNPVAFNDIFCSHCKERLISGLNPILANILLFVGANIFAIIIYILNYYGYMFFIERRPPITQSRLVYGFALLVFYWNLYSDFKKKNHLVVGNTNKRAISEIIGEMENMDAHFKIVETLGKIGKPAVVPLISALKEKDWRVRLGSALALGKIRDKRPIDSLIELLGDENENVKKAANDSLEKLRVNVEKALNALGEKEESEILASSSKETHFYIATYKALKSDVLPRIPNIYKDEAKNTTVYQFVKSLQESFGEDFLILSKKHDPDDDEFLVHHLRYKTENEWAYILTNKRLILFDSNDPYKSIMEFPLSKIRKYESSGLWTRSIRIIMKSGEVAQIDNLGFFPKDWVVNALINSIA